MDLTEMEWNIVIFFMNGKKETCFGWFNIELFCRLQCDYLLVERAIRYLPPYACILFVYSNAAYHRPSFKEYFDEPFFVIRYQLSLLLV